MTPESFSLQVRQILEEGALLFADPLEDPPDSEETDFHAQLRFEGGAQGVLRLHCRRGIGEQVARNLLGLEDHQSCDPELAESSLRELLNILGGSVIASLAEPGQIRMHTPEAESDLRLEGRELLSHWSVEGMPLTVLLTWSHR